MQYNARFTPDFCFDLKNSDTVPVASPTPPPHATGGRAELDSSPSALPPPWDAWDPGAGHENLGNWPTQMVLTCFNLRKSRGWT